MWLLIQTIGTGARSPKNMFVFALVSRWALVVHQAETFGGSICSLYMCMQPCPTLQKVPFPAATDNGLVPRFSQFKVGV